jgi:hypothetical protein
VGQEETIGESEMPRNYSDKFLLNLHREGNDTLGAILGKTCVKAKLPAAYVAFALKVSRMTVHAWFRGATIRVKNRKVIEAFIRLVKEDLVSGALPAQNTIAAKQYIESMIGMKI